jgi:hypothetical protein
MPMTGRTDEVFSLKEIGLLFRRDPAAVMRTAKAGKFGWAQIRGHRKFYHLAAAEAHYKTTTTKAEREAARQPRKTTPAMRLVQLVRNLRDIQWRECLTKQRIFGVRAPE